MSFHKQPAYLIRSRYCCILLGSLMTLLSAGDLHGQVLNRVYINGNYGYRHHSEFGGTVHLFNHLSVGYYNGVSNVLTGPAYDPGGGGLFSMYKHLKNRYTTSSFFIGITTRSQCGVNWSVMLGPSWMRALEYENIVVVKKDPLFHTESVTYTTVNKKAVGFVFRSDLTFQLSRHVGFNLGVQRNVNSLNDDFSVFAGLCIGLVEDLERY